MIPIGDDKLMNAIRPYVTWILILINVLVFLYEISLEGYALEGFIFKYGATPAQVLNGSNILSVFTSMFLHGGWMHLLGNMLFLWIFGDNIEAALGHFGFIVFYLLGGLAASLGHIFFNPESTIPSVGASGAISACMGAYLVMFPRSRVRMLIFLGFFITTLRVSAWIFLGVWILLQLISGTGSSQEVEGEGVAWWAHIGGFAFGIIAGLLNRGKARELIVVREEVEQRRGLW